MSTEALLAQIDKRLERIEITQASEFKQVNKHLEQLNGQVAKNTERSIENDKSIALIKNTCQFVSHDQKEDIKRIETEQKKTEERVLDFLKANAKDIGIIGTLLALIGKMSGLW